MEDIYNFFSAVIQLFKIPMNVYGYVFTFWDVFLFTAVVGLIMWFVGSLFNLG